MTAPETDKEHRASAGEDARRAAVMTLAAGAVIVVGLALWNLRLVVALLFLAFTIAAAMRPGIELLAGWRIPRAVGVLVHYVVLFGLVALFLSFVVPQLATQVQNALDAAQQPGHATGSGLKNQLLDALDKRLRRLPSGGNLVHPVLAAGQAAVEVIIGIFFTFATAAYWIFERGKTIDTVTRLLPRPKRKTVRDTWDIVDAKLGAYVRGQLILIVIVAVITSAGFWVINEPYWLLIGVAAGFVELIPIVGPLAVLIVAVGAGLTQSWHVAVFAAAVVLGVRLLEDYLLSPRILGGAVGLSSLLVLVSVSATGILLGSFYVLLAIPLAATVTTVIDVVVFGTDPAEMDTPSVLFSPGDADP